MVWYLWFLAKVRYLWRYHTLCKERGETGPWRPVKRLISHPRNSAQNDCLLHWKWPTWSTACPGSCKTCRNMPQCYCYQLKEYCNDFLCEYPEKSINPRGVITQYIIKGAIYSLTWDAILSCQYCIACSLSLSFEKKSNQQKFLLLLPFNKTPFKKNCNKKTSQTLHCFF